MSLIKKCRCKEEGRPAKEAWLKCAHPWVSKQAIVGFPLVYQKLIDYFRYAPSSYEEAVTMDKQVGNDIRHGVYNPLSSETRKKPSEMASELPLTLAALYAHYLTHHLKANRKAGASRDLPQQATIERHIRFFGGTTPLSDLDFPFLQRWATWLKTKEKRGGEGLLSSGTIHNEASIFWRLLRWGHERGYYPLPCTWKQMGFPPQSAGRTSRLDADVEEAVLAAEMPPVLRSFIHLALDTGQRSRALRGIQMKHVIWAVSEEYPFGGLLIPGENLKQGGVDITIPLTPRARQALQDRRDLYFSLGMLTPTTHLLGTQKGLLTNRTYFAQLWERLREEVPAIEGVTLHDLRAEAGTRIYEATGRLDVVMRFLGHTRITTTQKYMRATLNEPRAVMEILANLTRGREGTTPVPQVKNR